MPLSHSIEILGINRIYPIPVLVLCAPSNTYEDIMPLLQELVRMITLGKLNAGVNKVSAPNEP